MTANDTLLQKKYSRIIETYSEKYGVSLETALSRFYKSNLYTLIRDGVSDLHCMSEDYLSEELNEELNNKVQQEPPEKEPVEKESDGYGVIRKVKK